MYVKAAKQPKLCRVLFYILYITFDIVAHSCFQTGSVFDLVAESEAIMGVCVDRDITSLGSSSVSSRSDTEQN